ncbi:MAG: hypothetical protein EBV45_01655 [Chloroflexi bacterium]|nr:hypothetical protein [Chloroflexota bacterium]
MKPSIQRDTFAECDGHLDGDDHAERGIHRYGLAKCDEHLDGDCGGDIHIRRICDGKRNRDVIADDYSDA